MTSFSEKIKSGLIGVCVGDALGVPVEFNSREEMSADPVTGMRGYGSHDVPPGTWSDDSSLTFCFAEALSQEKLGENLFRAIAKNFCLWYNEGYWTAYGICFDIGNTTVQAIRNLQLGVTPTEAGLTSEMSNGNGSLMRVLPVAFCEKLLDFPDLINFAHQVSALTHRHLIAQMSCGIYVSIAANLLRGKDKTTAYLDGVEQIKTLYQNPDYNTEVHNFDRVLNHNIANFAEADISANGYVIHSLEASLWCFLNSNSYSEAVLKAVNLGDDTDTTAAITGGLAGIYYGMENIPSEWIETIAKKQKILDLAESLSSVLTTS
jgi:ADP-ribosylglycohydrolase